MQIVKFAMSFLGGEKMVSLMSIHCWSRKGERRDDSGVTGTADLGVEWNAKRESDA
tara:strand:+ start:1149 stop:1316 length:168 start_codon:yes stop_codon:yes gene_type:complete